MKLNLRNKIRTMKYKKRILLVAAGCVVLLFCIWLFYCKSERFGLDSRTVNVQDPKSLQEQVQKKADESTFAIRINSQIELESLEAEAPLYIRNPAENKYDTYVELISDTTREVLYKTKKLKPGDAVLKDKLSNLQETKKQPYTARFHILEKGKEISSIEYAITIEVKSKVE